MPYIEISEDIDVNYFYKKCRYYEKKELFELLKKEGFIKESIFDDVDIYTDKELIEKLKFIAKNSTCVLPEDWKAKINEAYEILSK